LLPFLKHRANARPESRRHFALGRLEADVMGILWAWGEGSVRDVVHKLHRPLAYTTVMTTLDRLFKKGLLSRRKLDRAYLYAPRLSRQEWERQRATNLLAGFLGGPPPARDLLISCLLDAVGMQDDALLGELEKKIRSKRREILRREQP
jgi:predicted transcriptional regulator